MKVQMFTLGILFTNTYVVSCEQTKETIIIDPAFRDKREAEKIFTFLEENVLELKSILNTHGHPDHTCGNNIVKEKFHVPIMIHEHDAYILGKHQEKFFEHLSIGDSFAFADILLHDGALVKFGKTTLKVVHTPGHTGGSISLLGEKEIFTGDTLFCGSIGRTDLPESSERAMRASLRRLAALPEDLTVYPGHGPTTTIGEEKRNNPFLQLL